jgi:RNA polymerase sigma factor (sigma-70 family)
MSRFLQAALANLKTRWSGQSAPTPDALLLEAYAQRGERDALELLVRRHAETVWRVCRRVLRSHQDAEDALQATFYILATKAKSIRKRDALGGWLHRVALRVALAARERHPPAAMPTDRAALDPSAEAREELALLDEEVDRLPAKYRGPVILCYFEGKTTAEAATALGIAEGTVYSRLARARERLRNRLVRRGVALGLAAKALEQSQAMGGGVSKVTIEQAVRLALADPAAAAAEFTAAVRLAKGVLTAMLMKQCKVALVIVVLLGCLGLGGWRLSLPTAAQAPVPPKKQQPAPVEQQPDLSALHKARIDAAAKLFDADKKEYVVGRATVAVPVYTSSLKWLEAERAANPADHVRALTAHRDRVLEMHSIAKFKHSAGAVGDSHYGVLEYALAEVDVWIAQEKARSSQPK